MMPKGSKKRGSEVTQEKSAQRKTEQKVARMAEALIPNPQSAIRNPQSLHLLILSVRYSFNASACG